MSDPVSHPKHYTSHPSGIETITISSRMPFCLGNAFKYLTRFKLKGNPIQDLEKCSFYLTYSLERTMDHKWCPEDALLEVGDWWVAREPDLDVRRAATLILTNDAREARRAVDELIVREKRR